MLTSRPRLYWKDQLANWEAYSILNTLRLVDLARSCIWALARQEAVCASIVARSALETAAAFVDAARTVTATITGPAERKESGLLNPAVNLRTTVVESQELEHAGGRMGGWASVKPGLWPPFGPLGADLRLAGAGCKVVQALLSISAERSRPLGIAARAATGELISADPVGSLGGYSNSAR